MERTSFAGRRLAGLMSVLFFLCVCLNALPSFGAECFVNKQGNDANDGQTRERAFLTIQKGVDALNPGDTLTIGAGEYFENVKRSNLGSMDADTTIRAEIPGTVLLRGDVLVPEFKKVDGYRFVYAAPFDQKPYGILQHDTLRIVHERANVPELEFDPGFFHYDAEAKLLYLSRSDLSSPQGRHYTAAVNGTHGMYFELPKRVVIEGLGFTGFFPEWGITLLTPESCVVRNSTFYLNVGGVVLARLDDSPGGATGSNNLIENCVCFGNSFGGVVRYYAHNDTVRNSYFYKNVREGQEHFGVMHYHQMTGPLLIQNNISWGHNFDFSVKPGPQQERLENCVGLGHIRIAPQSMDHSLFHGANEYGSRATVANDTVLFSGEKDLNWDKEFADSQNLDFRLQPDSRFRGAAPDKSDRGPYQYEANIFYASPTGDDAADGLSSRTPWKTLERALKDLRPGDTLYLSAGEYAGITWENAAGSDKPIKVLGRGRAPVTITGPMGLNGGTDLVFERLTFADTLSLNKVSNITLNNCVFSGKTTALSVQSAKGLRLTHGLFTEAPINVTDSEGVFLSGNLYAISGKPAVQLDADNAILYSDYNVYKDAANCWQVAGKLLSLNKLQKLHDVYSAELEPQLAEKDGALVLQNEIDFVGHGPNGTLPGVYHEYGKAESGFELVGPFLHSVSDTTANIEWWSTSPETYKLAWGETPDMTDKRRDYRGRERFNTFSLTGLKPGQTYYFKLTSPASSEPQTLSFTTATAAKEPRVYFVAPDGSDNNNGLTRNQALRTVSQAVNQVSPGDTIMIAGGDYNERVRIRAAGTKERPITVQSIPGQQATFRGGSLRRAFDVVLKPDYHFDGLYFRGWDMFCQGFVARESARLKFTRCLNTTIELSNCPESIVRNCVVTGYWNAISISGSPHSIIENNVFTSTILRQINGSGPAIARNNIFSECIRGKVHQTLLDIRGITESNNCFNLRWPANEKLAVNNQPLPIYCLKTGSDSFAANPMLPGMPGQLQGWQMGWAKDFDKFFTTNPNLIVRNIGLQPEAFIGRGIAAEDWPYTKAWAEEVLAEMHAADTLVEAGEDAKALKVYTALVADMPLSKRLKSDILEKASLAAERANKIKLAMELSRDIPIEPIAIRRQMQIMVAREQYDALLEAFSIEALGGRLFINAFAYPETEYLMVDLYYLRSLAHIATGNLEAAEADLRAVNDKRVPVGYTSGVGIHDKASLLLGNFYRDQLKDDAKALEAYLEVCGRTSWAGWGYPAKPVLTGASETLAKATQAACDILTKQGETDKVAELQARLTKAQKDAAAALQK